MLAKTIPPLRWMECSCSFPSNVRDSDECSNAFSWICVMCISRGICDNGYMFLRTLHSNMCVCVCWVSPSLSGIHQSSYSLRNIFRHDQISIINRTKRISVSTTGKLNGPTVDVNNLLANLMNCPVVSIFDTITCSRSLYYINKLPHSDSIQWFFTWSQQFVQFQCMILLLKLRHSSFSFTTMKSRMFDQKQVHCFKWIAVTLCSTEIYVDILFWTFCWPFHLS